MAQPGQLEIITGPMGSGKTAEMIARLERYRFAEEYNVVAAIAVANQRDNEFASRLGLRYPCTAVDSLDEIDVDDVNVVAVEEAHMFENADKELAWLSRRRKLGLHVLVSCIDIDYRGQMQPVMKGLYEQAPTNITRQTAACLAEGCSSIEARNTGLFIDGVRQREGDAIVPDVEGIDFKALCVDHF